MWLCVTVLAAIAAASVSGRAVNVSSTWLLPDKEFPVFYRYFRDKISWYEADAVCQFHHANLVTVDTSSQYDAVKAYLGEMNITNNIWVGLIKSNADGDFTWTDYRGLSGEGYWATAPEEGVVPLCAMSDPGAYYRWTAKGCGGPEVASFICELPVPKWATGVNGCMIKTPGIDVTYVPETAAVQLTEHCGDSSGVITVNNVICSSEKSMNDVLEELKCHYSPIKTNVVTTEISFPTTNKITRTDSPNEVSSTETTTTVDEATSAESNSEISPSAIPTNEKIVSNIPAGIDFDKNESTPIIIPIFDAKVINIMDDNNIENNIAKHEMPSPVSSNSLFSQSNDNFIPPLVLAKARLSEDLEAISERRKLEHEKKYHHLDSNIKEMLHEKTSSKIQDQDTLIKTTLLKASIKEHAPATSKEIIPTNSATTSSADISTEMVTTKIVSKLTKLKKYDPKKDFIREKRIDNPPSTTMSNEIKLTVISTGGTFSDSPNPTEDVPPTTIKTTNTKEDDILDLHIIIKDPTQRPVSTDAGFTTESVTSAKHEETPQEVQHQNENVPVLDGTPSMPSLNEESFPKPRRDRKIIPSSEKHGFNPLRILG